MCVYTPPYNLFCYTEAQTGLHLGQQTTNLLLPSTVILKPALKNSSLITVAPVCISSKLMSGEAVL